MMSAVSTVKMLWLKMYHRAVMILSRATEAGQENALLSTVSQRKEASSEQTFASPRAP